MTDNKRTHECRRKIVAALNEAKIPYATSELILENILYVVRENMEAQEAAAEKENRAGSPRVLPPPKAMHRQISRNKG